MSDTATPPADAPKAEPKQEPAKPAGDEPLGEPGKKALESEREARKEAESQLTALRKEFDTFRSALTEAVGIKPGKGDETDAITQVQQQLAQMQRENAVLALATQHGITDKDDLDLLRSAKDEPAMSKLAGRLAAKAETPGTPKPDTTQGGKATEKPDPGPGIARLREAYATTTTE